MAIPKINHCVLCEDARPESNGLATLLGFFGITPDVAILLEDFEKPLRSITLVLIGGSGELKGNVSGSILDAHERPVIQSPPMPINQTAPEGTRTSLIFVFGPVHFREPGVYKAIF